jgi:hypothetical protein
MHPLHLFTQWSLRLLIAFTLGAAALYKGVEIVEHGQQLAMAVPILQPPSARGLLSAVAGVEIALALGILAMPSSRWPLIGSAGLFTLFSGYLAFLLLLPETPSCRCLPIFNAGNAVQQAQLGIVRNVGLIGIVIWLMIQSYDRRTRSAEPLHTETIQV